jgi:serine kinase of HPr protein (carbohydrate metabolism regulator)
LALELIQAAATGRLAFSRLIADDRVHVAAIRGRLIARAPANLAGLMEIRGLGICRLPYEPMAVVRLVVDLGTAAERMPEPPPRRRISKACGCRVLRSHRARTPFACAAALH